MALRNPGRLAIHRRFDEIAFLQHRLRVLSEDGLSDKAREPSDVVEETASRNHHGRRERSADDWDLSLEVVLRERRLADELLHTRQTEPLGETLQRRLAMAERIRRDLAHRTEPRPQHSAQTDEPNAPAHGLGEYKGEQKHEPNREIQRDGFPDSYWVAEIERRALAGMLNHWWAWLKTS